MAVGKFTVIKLFLQAAQVHCKKLFFQTAHYVDSEQAHCNNYFSAIHSAQRTSVLLKTTFMQNIRQQGDCKNYLSTKNGSARSIVNNNFSTAWLFKKFYFFINNVLLLWDIRFLV